MKSAILKAWSKRPETKQPKALKKILLQILFIRAWVRLWNKTLISYCFSNVWRYINRFISDYKYDRDIIFARSPQPRIKAFRMARFATTAYKMKPKPFFNEDAGKLIIQRFYHVTLYIRFRKKTLFVTLSTTNHLCIFSLSAGMFVPGYKSLKKTKEARKRHITYIRQLKKKQKKLYNKKKKIRRWKSARHSKTVRLYTIRYVKAILQSTPSYSLLVYLRGRRRRFKRFLWELFIGPRKSRVTKNLPRIRAVVFLTKYEYTCSVRAIKKRLSRRFKV